MNHLPYDETDYLEADPLMMPKTSKGNLIRLSDFYKDYCGTPEYVEVSDEVLTFLIESKREEKKIQMRDYRHLASFSFKEKEMAEISGVYEPSTEEILMKAYIFSALHEAIDSLNPTSRRRIILYYFDNLSIKCIAQIEGVTPAAIRQNLEVSISILRKKLSDYCG